MAVTPQTNTTLEEIAVQLSQHDNFALCGHVSPDGDCLGSQLALAFALKAMGKQVTCLLAKDEPVDATLKFIPGIDALVPAAKFDGSVETFVALDVPTRERMGQDAARVLDEAAFTVTVDHHAVDSTMTQLVYEDPDSASTSVLVWKLCKLLLEDIPTECAVCAYTGLATDTGNFQYQNADAIAFTAAAEMVRAGADPAQVARNVSQNRSLASLLLDARSLQHMRLFNDGTCVVSWISDADMRETGAEKPDTEPLVNTLRSIRGVQVACMLREQDGHVRGSLRAKGDADVAQVARAFGGGGHKAAAGFTMDPPLAQAVETVIAAINEAFDNGAAFCAEAEAQA